MGRRKRSTRVTASETEAWRHRPRGCVVLSEAVRLHAKAELAVRAQTAQSDLAVVRGLGHARFPDGRRRLTVFSPPRRVDRSQHPLRTGLATKIYYRYDFFTPVIDAMEALAQKQRASTDAFGLFHKVKESEHQEPLHNLLDEPGGRFCATRTAAWTCGCCGTSDASTQIRMQDSIVCRCGVVVSTNAISTHREKLGALEVDDATQHADRVRDDSSTKFDRGPPSKDELRAAHRFSATATQLPTQRVAGLGRICDAARISAASAAKTKREDEVGRGEKLTLAEEARGVVVLQQLEALFKRIAPVEQSLRREARILADRVWFRASRHCRSCPQAEACEVRLTERKPVVIAAAALDIVVGVRLDLDDGSIDGARRQHAVDVRARLSRSAAFTHTSARGQVAAAKGIIEALSSVDFKPTKRCAGAPPQPKSAGATPQPKMAGATPQPKNDDIF